MPVSSTAVTSLLALFATTARASLGRTAMPDGALPDREGTLRKSRSGREVEQAKPCITVLVTTAVSRSGSTATLDGRFPTTTGCTTVSSVVFETFGPGFWTVTL